MRQGRVIFSRGAQSRAGLVRSYDKCLRQVLGVQGVEVVSRGVSQVVVQVLDGALAGHDGLQWKRVGVGTREV